MDLFSWIAKIKFNRGVAEVFAEIAEKKGFTQRSLRRHRDSQRKKV
jgi:hypothetical protein